MFPSLQAAAALLDHTEMVRLRFLICSYAASTKPGEPGFFMSGQRRSDADEDNTEKLTRR